MNMSHIRPAALLLCAVAAAVSSLAHGQPATPPAPPPAPVLVDQVVRLEAAATTPVTGSVHSRNELQVTAGIDGRIAEVAEPGTAVRQGQPLMRIDTAVHELRRAELQAQAERARAQLRFLDAQLGRQEGLANSRAISANDLEQTRSQRDMAASDLRIAEVRLLQVAEDIGRATVRAEFDGVVTQRLRRVGEDVSRGTVVAEVIDTGSLEVRVPTPLQHDGRIAVGDVLRVRGFGRDLQATVRSVVPGTDPRRQTFELRLDLPADGGGRPWSIGELVSVDLPVLADAGALAVPEDALVLRQEGAYVFRITESNTAERIAVEVGDSHDGTISVSGDGLEAGDRVVVRGGETLGPDQPVTIL